MSEYFQESYSEIYTISASPCIDREDMSKRHNLDIHPHLSSALDRIDHKSTKAINTKHSTVKLEKIFNHESTPYTLIGKVDDELVDVDVRNVMRINYFSKPTLGEQLADLEDKRKEYDMEQLEQNIFKASIEKYPEYEGLSEEEIKKIENLEIAKLEKEIMAEVGVDVEGNPLPMYDHPQQSLEVLMEEMRSREVPPEPALEVD